MGKITLYDNRKVVTLFRDEETSLTFLKPHSGEWENHLIVVYEDAYGDFGGSIMHKDTIKERYEIDDKTITEIFNTLKDGIN